MRWLFQLSVLKRAVPVILLNIVGLLVANVVAAVVSFSNESKWNVGP